MTLQHIIFDLFSFANAFTICSARALACIGLFPLANHLQNKYLFPNTFIVLF